MARFAPALAPDLDFLLLKNPHAPEGFEAAENVTEHVVTIGSNNPLSMWFLPRFAPLERCDVFHATANTLPAGLSVKTVVTLHDLMWLDHPEWCDQTPYAALKRWYFGQGIRRSLAHADRIAAISQATRRAVLARQPTLAKRCHVTLSGVGERFKPAPHDEATLARYRLAGSAPFALVVGQFAPYKNHEGALRGFARAVEGCDALIGAKLVLVQRQGPSRAKLESLARSLGLAERLVFTGPVSEDDLIQLYSRARALIHPSFCEGFGNPVAEAMACGCPVITSDRSAMPEVAGNAALLIDPGDPVALARAIRTVWKAESARHRMRRAGLERAQELSWIDFARSNIAIYRELLGSN
ncbi:MAG: glycosyltransferase family 1 protein [Erythrobacter sp.]|nr:glycosyltransferase family 1 protein [Erythrobacter sp.]MDJ0979108.1 glycosyltransferase family 1 protein [Erythrobacter sp.]